MTFQLHLFHLLQVASLVSSLSRTHSLTHSLRAIADWQLLPRVEQTELVFPFYSFHNLPSKEGEEEDGEEVKEKSQKSRKFFAKDEL